MLGKVAHHRGGEPAQIACGRDLLRLGQPIGIDELGARHAEALRGGVHALDEGLVRAGHRLGQHDRHIIGRLDNERLEALLDRHLGAHGQADLGRRLHMGELRAADLGFERDFALLDRLEHDVGRHDLGEGGRVPLVILVLRVEDLPIPRIEQERWSRERRGRGQHQQDCRCYVCPPFCQHVSFLTGAKRWGSCLRIARGMSRGSVAHR